MAEAAAALAAGAAAELGDSDAEDARRARQERTGTWTHYCCHAARLLFLLSHGLFVLAVSGSLHRLEKASWPLLFLPLWVGMPACILLAVASWFASCPYVQLCLSERLPRLGERPSILTEILPDIVLAVMGFIFLVIAFAAESMFCVYLDSAQRGAPRALPAAATLFSIAGLMATCHGVCFMHSPLYLIGGSGLLATVVMFTATRGAGPHAQAMAVLPAVFVVVGLEAVALNRLRGYWHFLSREERILRGAEAAVLATLALATTSLQAKVRDARLAEAGSEAAALGLGLCAVAALHVRLSYLETWKGPLHERLFTEGAGALMCTASPREVQISMTDASQGVA